MYKHLIPLLIVVMVLSFALPVSADTQTMNLVEGFNFYAVTVQPDSVITAESLVKADPNIKSIFKFNTTTQAFQYYLRTGASSYFGDSFTMDAGAGYVIETTAATKVEINGTPSSVITSQNLAKGFNLVGFSTVESNPMAKAGILASNSAVKSIFKWNYNTKSFDFVTKLDNGTLFGTDFAMAPGDSFFIDMSESAVVKFGDPTTHGTSTLNGLISGVTAAPGVSRAVSGVFEVGLYTATDVFIKKINSDSAGNFTFTDIDANTSYKIIAKGPNNEFISGFVGKVGAGTYSKTFNGNTTVLALMIEKNVADFATLLASDPASFQNEEDRLYTQMADVIPPIVSNLSVHQQQLAGRTLTLAELKSEMASRIEITDAISQQLKSAYSDPDLRFQEAMDKYNQAIALISSEAGKSNADYVQQALSLLSSITGTSYDNLSADDQKKIEVAKAAAYNYMGDIKSETFTETTSAPRSFMAAYNLNRSIGDTTDTNSPAYYYNKAYQTTDDLKKKNPDAASDPGVLAQDLKSTAKLAENDPKYASQASQAADALLAKVDTENPSGGALNLGFDKIDPVDILKNKADAQLATGNNAGAIVVLGKIDDYKNKLPADKIAKAEKTKNYGIGKAKMLMGDLTGAFDNLKAAVKDVVEASGDVDTNNADFKDVNSALLAMAGVVEKLNSMAADQNSEDYAEAKAKVDSMDAKFKDPKTIASKIDKKSEVYVKVVYVIVDQNSDKTFDSIVLNNDTDNVQKAMNEAMAKMTDFIFAYQNNGGTPAMLSDIRDKFKNIRENLTSETQEATLQNIKTIRARALFQIAMTYFYEYSLSIRKQQKDEALRNKAEIYFNDAKNYDFLAKDISDKLDMLKKMGSVVETITDDDYLSAAGTIDNAQKLLGIPGAEAGAKALIDMALAKLNAILADTTRNSNEALVKEVMILRAKALFFRYLSIADGSDKDAALAQAKANLKALKAKYDTDDVISMVDDLLGKLSANENIGDGVSDAAVKVASSAGDSVFPAILKRAKDLKAKAKLYLQSTDPADVENGKAIVVKAVKLLDLIVDDVSIAQDDATLRDRVIGVLTDQKTSEVEAILGESVLNEFKTDNVAFRPDSEFLAEGKYPFWKRIAAIALQEKALIYKMKYDILKNGNDKKKALEFAEKVLARFKNVPFKSDIYDLIDIIKGLEVSYEAPQVEVVGFQPMPILAASLEPNGGTVENIIMDAMVIDPAGKKIEKVVAKVFFNGQLLKVYPVVEYTPATGSASPIVLLPGVNRDVAATQSQYWKATIPAADVSKVGDYAVEVVATNSDNAAGRGKGGFYVKPSSTDNVVDIPFFRFNEDTGMFEIEISGTLADDVKVLVDVRRIPKGAFAGEVPEVIEGFGDIPLSKVQNATRNIYQVPADEILNDKLGEFGEIELLFKIVDNSGNILISRPFVTWHEKKIDVTTDPVVKRFKEFLAIFNYSKKSPDSLTNLEKFVSSGYETGKMPAAAKELYGKVFQTLDNSAITILKDADGKELIHVYYDGADFAEVEAKVSMSGTYGSELSEAILDADLEEILPKGIAGFAFKKNDIFKQQFRKIGGTWYAVFDQYMDAASTTADVFNLQAMLSKDGLDIYSEKAIDLSKYRVVASVLKDIDPERGIYEPSVISQDFINMGVSAMDKYVDQTTGASMAHKFFIDKNRLIPSNFPVYGPLLIVAKLVKVDATSITEDVLATISKSFFRQRPIDNTLKQEVIDAAKSVAIGYGELITMFKAGGTITDADIEAKLAPYMMYNFQTEKVPSSVIAVIRDMLTGITDATVTIDDPTMVILPDGAVELAVKERWHIVYNTARTTDLKHPDDNLDIVLMPAGHTEYDFEFFQKKIYRKVSGKWYWEFKDETASNSGSVESLVDFYFEGEMLVVKTSMDFAANYDVKFSLLKDYDGTEQKIAEDFSIYKPTSVDTKKWFYPINKIMDKVTEPGEFIVRATLYKDGTPQGLTMDQFLHKVVSVSSIGANAIDVIKKVAGIMSDSSKDKTTKLNDIAALSCDLGNIGTIPPDIETVLSYYLDNVDTLSVSLDEYAQVNFPDSPDYGTLMGSLIIKGILKNDMNSASFNALIGTDLLPFGVAGDSINHIIPFPVGIVKRDDKWYMSLDTPDNLFTANMPDAFIQELFWNFDQKRLEVVVNFKDDLETLARKIKVSILRDTPTGLMLVGDNYKDMSMQLIPNSKVVTSDGRFKYRFAIDSDVLFGANFPVNGMVNLEAQLYKLDNGTFVKEGNNRSFMYDYMPAQSTFVNVLEPAKDVFKKYLGYLKALNISEIEKISITNGVAGTMPQGEKDALQAIIDNVEAGSFQFTYDEMQIDIAPGDSSDKAHAFVPVTVSFKYKPVSGMTVHPPIYNVATNDLMLPEGTIGETINYQFFVDMPLKYVTTAQKWMISYSNENVNTNFLSPDSDTLYFTDAWFDESGNFLVKLNRPLKNGPGEVEEGYTVRAELFAIPEMSFDGTTPMPKPIPNFSYPTILEMGIDPATNDIFKISKSRLFPDTLPVYGHIDVQAVLYDRTNETKILGDIWHGYERVRSISDAYKEEIRSRINDYFAGVTGIVSNFGTVADGSLDDTNILTGIDGSPVPNLFYGDYQTGHMTDFEKEIIKTIVKNFRSLSIDSMGASDFQTYLANNMDIRPIGDGLVEVIVPIRLDVVYRAIVFPDAKDNGIFDADGMEFFPPASGIFDDSQTLPVNKIYTVDFQFVKRLQYDDASGKWYLINEDQPVNPTVATPGDINIPKIFFAGFDTFNGEDVIGVGTSLVNSNDDGNHADVVAGDYKVTLELQQQDDMGNYVDLGSAYNRIIPYFGNGKYGMRKADVFNANFPFYGMIKLVVKIVRVSDGSVVDVKDFDYYNQFNSNLDETSEVELKGQLKEIFAASLTALANPVWDSSDSSAPGALQELRAISENGFVPPSVHDLWTMIHNNISDFNALFGNEDMIYMDMLNPNEVVMHADDIKWTGTYKQDVMDDIFGPNGNLLIPAGTVGESFESNHPAMRHFVKVYNQDGTFGWKISAFDDSTPVDPTMGDGVPGMIVDLHTEFDPISQKEMFVARVFYEDTVSVTPVLDVDLYDVNTSTRITDGSLMNSISMGNPVADTEETNIVSYSVPREMIFGDSSNPFPDQFNNKPIDIVVSHIFNGQYFEQRMPFINGTQIIDEDYNTERPDPNDETGSSTINWPMQFNVRHGFANDGNVVSYVDFGPVDNPDNINEIYIYSDGSNMLMIPPVFKYAPNDGSGSYSDIAHLNFITPGAIADFNDPSFIPYRSVTEIEAAVGNGDITLDTQETILLEAPIVPMGSAIVLDNGAEKYPMPGYYDGKRVQFFPISQDLTGSNPFAGINGSTLPTPQKFYGFVDNENVPIPDQDIFEWIPGESSYSPIVQTCKVTVDSTYVFGTYTTQSDVDGSGLPVNVSTSYRHMAILFAGDPGAMNGIQIQNIDVVPVPGAIAVPMINLAAFDTNIGGTGFGPWMNVADKGLFFKPSFTDIPIKIVDNIYGDWSDSNIHITKDIWDNYLIPNLPSDIDLDAGVTGDVFIGAVPPLDTEGHIRPLSNIVPVILRNEAFVPRMSIDVINGAAVSSTMVQPYLINTTIDAVIDGTNFGDQITSGEANEALIWRAVGEDGKPASDFVPLLFNNESGWSGSTLNVPTENLGYMYQAVPGFFAIALVQDGAVQPDMLLSNPIPVFEPEEGAVNPQIQEVEGTNVSDLSDTAPEVDLTGKVVGDTVVVKGISFSEPITDSMPKMDIVFVTGVGAPLPLAGNNLTGWTDGQITITLTQENMPVGHGFFIIRNLMDTEGDGYVSNPFPVKFAGGVDIVANIESINGIQVQPISNGLNTFMDSSSTSFNFAGTGFIPASSDVTFYMYFLNNPDPSAATISLELAKSSEDTWSSTGIEVDPSKFMFNQEGGIFGVDGNGDDSGLIVIMDGPLGVGRVISSPVLVTFSKEDIPTISIDQINEVNPVPPEFSQPIDLTGTVPVVIKGGDFNINNGELKFAPANGMPPFVIMDNSASTWSTDEITFEKPAIFGPGWLFIDGEDESGNMIFSNKVPVDFGIPPLKIDSLNEVNFDTATEAVDIVNSLEVAGIGFGGYNSTANRVLAFVTESNGTVPTGYPIINNSDSAWTDTKITVSALPQLPSSTYGMISIFNIESDGTIDYSKPLAPGFPVHTPYLVNLEGVNPPEAYASVDSTAAVTATGTGFDASIPMMMVYLEFDPSDPDGEPVIKIPLAKNSYYTGTEFTTTGDEQWEVNQGQVTGMFPKGSDLPEGMTGHGVIMFVDVTNESDPQDVSRAIPFTVDMSALNPSSGPVIEAINQSTVPTDGTAIKLDLNKIFNVTGTGFGTVTDGDATMVLVFKPAEGTDNDITLVSNGNASANYWTHIDSLGKDIIYYSEWNVSLMPTAPTAGTIYLANVSDTTTPVSNAVNVEFITPPPVLYAINNNPTADTNGMEIPIGDVIDFEMTGVGDGGQTTANLMVVFEDSTGAVNRMLANDSQNQPSDTGDYWQYIIPTTGDPAYTVAKHFWASASYKPTDGATGFMYVADCDTNAPLSAKVAVKFVENTTSTSGTAASIASLANQTDFSSPIDIVEDAQLNIDGTGFGEGNTSPVTIALVFRGTDNVAHVLMDNGSQYDWTSTNILYFPTDSDNPHTSEFNMTVSASDTVLTGDIYIASIDATDTPISNVVSVVVHHKPQITSLKGETVLNYDQNNLPALADVPSTTAAAITTVEGSYFGEPVSDATASVVLAFVPVTDDGYYNEDTSASPIPIGAINDQTNWSDSSVTVPANAMANYVGHYGKIGIYMTDEDGNINTYDLLSNEILVHIQ